MEQQSLVCPSRSSPTVEQQPHSMENEEESYVIIPKMEPHSPPTCSPIDENSSSCSSSEETEQPNPTSGEQQAFNHIVKIEQRSRSCSPTMEQESSSCSSSMMDYQSSRLSFPRLRQQLSSTSKQVKQQPPPSPTTMENESLSSSPIDPKVSFPSYAEVEEQLAAFAYPIMGPSGVNLPLDQQKKMYLCPHPGCRSNFDRPYRLAQHILAHNNIRPYICDQPNCSKAYTSKSHLDRHKISVHLPHDKDVVYSCPQCMNTFANRQNLKRHMNTVHTSEFTCEFCNMHFKKKNQLSTHMYQHTGIKAFKCDLCTDTFISLYLKKRHMRYHKMYTCEECNIEFNHWSKFQKHKKTEHEKSEFTCNECGRGFKQRTHILRHVKIHSEEHQNRAFLCPYENCERFYSRNSNLKQHILIKHMQMFHVCHLCNAQLSSKAKLNHHVQLHYRTGLIPVKKKENTERKERKDEGSHKSSTALKLSGLTEIPVEIVSTPSTPVNLSIKSECIEVEVDIPI